MKLTLPQSNETLRNIQKILTNYVVRTKTIERKDLPPIFERDDLPPISEEPPLTPRTPRLSYESPWQVPWAADLNSMRQLGASLRNPLDAENVEHGLKFLTSACDDLPGEFFLQPPYIVLVKFRHPSLEYNFMLTLSVLRILLRFSNHPISTPTVQHSSGNVLT